MFDEQEINQLKEVFATKKDIEGLIEIVATKQEMRDGFENLRKEMNDRFDELKDQEIKPFKERMRKVENALAIE